MKKIVPGLCLVFLLLPAVLPAQTARTLLIEEFTGTWCQYCPFGADTLEAILSSMGNVRALSYHGGSGSEPYQTTEGNTMLANLPVVSWPTANIDRMVWNTGTPQAPTYVIPLSRSLWRAATIIQLANRPTQPLSYTVTGTYDTTTRLLSATVNMNILDTMAGEYLLNVVLSEDSLNYSQTLYTPSGTVQLNPYYHFHVVRKMITGPFGLQISSTGLSANTTVWRTVSYTLPASWNVKKVKITAFVIRHETAGAAGNYREVQGTYQANLKGSGSPLVMTPVELIAFNAEQSNTDVHLTWRTASENNNMGWYVERRTVENDWSTLAFIPGAGTTKENQRYEYFDRTAEPNTLYSYRLRQTDYDGRIEYSDKFMIMVYAVPTETSLMQNYPNPFNPTTEIGVQLAQPGEMSLDIYDMLGRKIRTLAQGLRNAGEFHFSWDGIDASGQVMPAGTYLCRLTTPELTMTKQMQLSK